MPFKRSRPTRPATGFRRGPRIADLMTADYYAFVDSSSAAERDGDAATALEYHQGIPMFSRSGHRALLEQLAGLADEMTPWLWARWAAYQCTRAEDPGTDCSAILRMALEYTVRMFHDDAMAQAFEEGGDPIRVMARVAGEDWAFHQLCTYELGGLACFLETMPTGRLAEEAQLAESWADAWMGGYRLVSSAPGSLVVRDLASDQPVELLDLGARLHAAGDGWLIGRIVPSGTTPGLMFDTRPLPVDAETATETAAGDVRGAWVTALDRAFRSGRIDPAVLQSEDRELVTDVASLDMFERGTPTRELADARERLADGRDEIGRAAFRILRAVAEGSFGSDADAPYVAAAAVNAHGYAEAVRKLVRPEHRGGWEHWAMLVPDPARGRLLRLTELCDAAAA
jgi:hypothetical protein